VFDIGHFVAGVLDYHIGWADAGNPGTAYLAIAKGIKQDREPREVQREFWTDSLKRDLIFELAQVLGRSNDWRVDSQYMESQPVGSAIVANLDYIALAELVECLGELIVLFSLLIADRVEKRVPDLGRYLQWTSGLGFLVAISHRYVPIPSPEKSPYS
jgi:hypothetical protein